MSSWKGKTRGGLLGYKIFIYILRTFGLGAAYFILRFVSAYFVASAPKASISIYRYFRDVHRFGRFRSTISIFKSYYVFGQTILDKIAIGSGMRDKFEYTFDGIEHLKSNHDGGVIVSAHVGNWEVAGLLLSGSNLKTNILVFENEHARIKKFLTRIMGDSKVEVIPMKSDMSHIFKINQALKSKEFICMHGDRFVEGSRTTNRTFMGKDAAFPLGPFSIISKLGVPYSFAYAMRGNGRTYHLSATPFKSNRDPQVILDQYLSELEKKVMAYPFQWFNYYDFWSLDVQGAKMKDND